MRFPIEALKDWFLANRRSLPWRRETSPYRVWISEVMLQQTQVNVVIAYFERWMAAFPTIADLAAAPLEKVIKEWEGLGYYSRARYLHQAARYLLLHHGAALPEQPEFLAKIKGIGPYTQGAIRSFAFKQKAAAVDGNVLRVLSRFLALEEEIERSDTKNTLTRYAESILPDQEPWLISEGLIELGALICTKTPRCNECPLKVSCRAFRLQKQTLLPKRKQRAKILLLKRHLALISHGDHILVHKVAPGRLMADLYEFPYLESKEPSGAPQESLQETQKYFEELFHTPLTYLRTLAVHKHSFTRYRALLVPHLFESPVLGSLCESYFWKPRKELLEMPFSSGHRRVCDAHFVY